MTQSELAQDAAIWLARNTRLSITEALRMEGFLFIRVLFDTMQSETVKRFENLKLKINPTHGRIAFICPSCESLHILRYKPARGHPKAVCNAWNGDKEFPTFERPIKRIEAFGEENPPCIVRVTDGIVHVLPGSAKNAGQSFPLAATGWRIYD